MAQPDSEDQRPRRPLKKGSGHPAATLVVTVVRSGGIAGLRRQWQARPAPEDEARWRELVDSCPWDDDGDPDAAGADRFVWSIRADVPDGAHEARVPDSRLHGPWRALVDAVREAER